jgi:hypothetical protein
MAPMADPEISILRWQMEVVSKLLSIMIENELRVRWPRLFAPWMHKKNEPKPLPTIENLNAQGTILGVFEDDGTTGYLYVKDANTREMLAACWLYNRVQTPTLAVARSYAERGQAPPLPKEFKNRSFAPPRYTLSPPNVRIEWNSRGTVVKVLWYDDPLGMIAFDWDKWRSFPYMLEEPCHWGDPLTKDVLDRYSNF